MTEIIVQTTDAASEQYLEGNLSAIIIGLKDISKPQQFIGSSAVHVALSLVWLALSCESGGVGRRVGLWWLRVTGSRSKGMYFDVRKAERRTRLGW